MGVVYAALDPRLKRQVAIKFLAPELTRDETAKQRFLQEAQAVSAIDHANVCTVHEIDEIDEGQLYLVMAHYDGETLKQRIARGPLPVAEAVDIGRQVGEGLAAAHAAGVVHRDIKPANIIVTTAGVAKILDFGIAKLTGVTGLTETGITLGTVAYMSPEQINGEEADQQSDVWAWGAVLYEMLSGQPPFRGDRAAVVMRAIIDLAPRPLQEIRPETPSDVVRVVRRALEKSRSRRHPTARELLAKLPGTSTPISNGAEANAVADATRSTRVTVAPIVATSETPSIAVLPFSDMSPGKDQDCFCEGLAEELIDALARLDGLRVVARTSAFRFKGQEHDLRQVGDQLNVRTVLEGSVRKAGSRLRINAQLINAVDGYHLWSERYDRDMDDVFAVQDEIARSVVAELQVKLLGGSERPLVVRPTRNLNAYHAYVKGRHSRLTRYDALKAGEFYEEAVRRDPDYAAAWAGVADAAVMAGNNLLRPPDKAAATARAAVERALALDDRLSAAHTALGKIRLYFDWQWDEADRAFSRALELNPSDVDARTGYGSFLAWTGRTDAALAQLAQAQELDPLSALACALKGIAFNVAHRYDEASIALHQALDLQPDMTLALWHLNTICMMQGRHDEGLALLGRVREGSASTPLHLNIFGHALARAGKRADVEKLLMELRDRGRREYVSPFVLAGIYNGLGELDECVRCLQEAYEEGSPGFVYLLLPFWDPPYSDPRIRDFRSRMNFPVQSGEADRTVEAPRDGRPGRPDG